MAKENQTDNADLGGGDKAPEPSASAATAAGAVGPAALAASELPSEAARTAQPEPATEAGAGLNQDVIETLRSLVQKVGGVDALIRWLQLHPDLK